MSNEKKNAEDSEDEFIVIVEFERIILSLEKVRKSIKRLMSGRLILFLFALSICRLFSNL